MSKALRPAVTLSRNTLLRRPVAGSAQLTNPFTVALLTAAVVCPEDLSQNGERFGRLRSG